MGFERTGTGYRVPEGRVSDVWMPRPREPGIIGRARYVGDGTEVIRKGRASMTNTATDRTTGSLTAMDRCDRCGAQAYLRVELSSGGELLFCAHHASKHREKLAQVAARIHDETARLKE